MAELYYNQLTADQQKQIGFILVNDDTAAGDMNRLKSAGSFQKDGSPREYLPTVQDDSSSTVMNALSNNDPYPKDDMVVIDRDGHVIKYFTNRESNMSNKASNNIKKFVMALTKPEYKNPCAAEKVEVEESKEDSSDSKDVSSSKDGESKDDDSKDDSESKDTPEKDSEEMAGQNGLYKLKETCMQSEADCRACSGKFKNSKCFLKKKMKCSQMKSEALCKLAECKYSKAKKAKKAKKGRPAKKAKPAKCKGKGIF